MSDAYSSVLDALVMQGSKSRDVRQNHAMFQCPAHEDRNPSLSVDDRDDRVMLFCHAGCHTDDVLAALGMEVRDLFDGDDYEADQKRSLLVRSYLYEHTNGDPWFHVDRYYPKTFRQRLPGVDPVRSLDDPEVRTLGLRGRAPVIYHAPRIHRAMRREEPTTVWWCDGEKDVETAERHGLVATCAPGFAKWDSNYANFMRKVDEVVIVVDQDKEKKDGSLGAGQAGAVTARDGFRSVGVKVRVVSPAVGKDLTDHFNGGYGVDDFVLEPTMYTRPRGMKADHLMSVEFPPLVFAVEDVLPAGLAIMAGSPKAGKTWCALSFSLAVALGGPALGGLKTTQGHVLHLAREDNYRRLQSRISLLLGKGDAPPLLEMVPVEEDWLGGEQGIANMQEWADEVGDPRLVVIDTLAKVEPEMGEDQRGGAYTGNYRMMARYKEWADRNQCCVLMIHHDNKTKIEEGSDPFSRISGTRGLTGAADTLLFLEKKRKGREDAEISPDGLLYVTGRDVPEDTIELRKDGPIWTRF